MRASLLLPALLAIAGCAPKASGDGTTATPAPKLEPLPADALLWEGGPPPGVEKGLLLEKDGILKRTPKVEEGVWWPFSLDYWPIARTDLEPLLAPHVGRRVRVYGHFKKTYDDATWSYEVTPVKIIALADAAK